MDNRQLTARQAVAKFLKKWLSTSQECDDLTIERTAGELVQSLHDDGFLVVRRGDASHGIQPPTGEMGAVPS